MADVSVAKDAVGSPALALVANEITTITFGDDLASVEVYSNGTAPVWWTCDGSTPAVDGPFSYYLPTLGTDTRQPRSGNKTVVKVLSTGTPTVRVGRAD